jgi:hypothetical protein
MLRHQLLCILDGRQAAAALDRLRNDKPRLLPDSAIAKVVPINSGSQGAP